MSKNPIQLGRVVGAHGVRGWLKVLPFAAGDTALLKAARWYLHKPQVDAAGAFTSFAVKTIRPAGQHLLVQLAGVDDRTQAQALRGLGVWLERADFPATAPDEYYWVDLIDCWLFGRQDDAEVLLGKVEQVFDNGAHAVLEVALGQATEQGSEFTPLLDDKGRKRTVLVPFVQAHILTVDLAARVIRSNWPAEF